MKEFQNTVDVVLHSSGSSVCSNKCGLVEECSINTYFKILLSPTLVFLKREAFKDFRCALLMLLLYVPHYYMVRKGKGNL